MFFRVKEIAIMDGTNGQNKSGLNAPKKDYSRPMHTTEHILNQAMCRRFNCGRAFSAHIEAKKSKCDYRFEASKVPSAQELAAVEAEVNAVIARNLDVFSKIVTREEAAKCTDLSRLPQDECEMVKLVFVGDYEVCPCIGAHVANTSELGKFCIISTDYKDSVLRIRWKVEAAACTC